MKEKTAEEILDYCKPYITCTDGSYEACLYFEGYHKIKKQDDMITKVIEEFKPVAQEVASAANG